MDWEAFFTRWQIEPLDNPQPTADSFLTPIDLVLGGPIQPILRQLAMSGEEIHYRSPEALQREAELFRAMVELHYSTPAEKVLQ